MACNVTICVTSFMGDSICHQNLIQSPGPVDRLQIGGTDGDIIYPNKYLPSFIILLNNNWNILTISLISINWDSNQTTTAKLSLSKSPMRTVCFCKFCFCLIKKHVKNCDLKNLCKIIRYLTEALQLMWLCHQHSQLQIRDRKKLNLKARKVKNKNLFEIIKNCLFNLYIGRGFIGKPKIYR